MSDSLSPPESAPLPIEFSILGPLEVRRSGATVGLPGGRPRLLLVQLLLEWGRPLTSDAIIDRLWGESPPASAAKTVQKYVWELRRVLGSDVDGFLTTEGRGYALRADADALDANRFETLVHRARSEPAARATALLERAETLWRGPALEGFADLPEVQASARRLDEIRLSALEQRLGLLLELGRHAEALPELERLTLEHPLREQLWAHLMLGCAASGRRHDALAAFQRVRLHLAEELGIEPSSHLVEIEQRILDGDPSLAPQPASSLTAPAPTRGVGIPTPLSSFIGRARLLHDLEHVLTTSRLVTLTGAGGSGKTRLAIEAARRQGPSSTGGTWFVDLSAVDSSDPVVAATAAAVGLPNQPGTDPGVLLLEAIGTRDLLLVLDNCEHVVDQCAPLVETLLAACPKLTVLATSQEPLGPPGERIIPVPPLAVPDPAAADHEVRASEAVELFVARARDIDPAFDPDAHLAATAEICTRLNGLPLALELAAAQVHAMTPADISSLLDDQFGILTSAGGRPARQATLRAAIDWSYERLDATEQLVFGRISSFPGSFDLSAATAIAAGDEFQRGSAANTLTRLVRRSMVERAEDRFGRARYRLLDSLRAYGRERLANDSGEHRWRLAHARHFAALARQHADPKPSGGDHWHLILAADYHNLQAALAYATEHDPPLAADLAFDMSLFWTRTDQVVDGLRYVDPLLERRELDPIHRARLLCSAAELRAEHGEAVLAGREAAEALAIFDEHGEEQPVVRARLALARAKANAGELDDAASLMEQAKLSFAAAGDARWARTGHALGSVYLAQGDHERAHREYEAVRRWARRHGLAFTCAKAEWMLGVVARHRGDIAVARTYCQRAHDAFVDIDDRSAVAHVRMTLGDIARLAGDRDEARALYDDAYAALSDIGDRRCTASAMKNLGDLERHDDARRAAELYLECLDRRAALGDRWGLAEALEGIAGALNELGETKTAVPLLAHADLIRTETGAVLPAAEETNVGDLRVSMSAALPPSHLARLWASGAAFTVDEATAHAHAAVEELSVRPVASRSLPLGWLPCL